MPTRKRSAPRADSGLQQQQPPLRRFKSVQGGKEVLLHVGEGDSAEALLDQSGFKLYKRNLSEPAPLAIAKSAASVLTSPPSVSPPKMRLPTVFHSAPVNTFPQTMTITTSAAMATTKRKEDFLPIPPVNPIVPELKRSDSDGDSGAHDDAPLNLSISRDVIRTDNDVLVVEEPFVNTRVSVHSAPPVNMFAQTMTTMSSVVRPAAIPALMPIRDGKIRADSQLRLPCLFTCECSYASQGMINWPPIGTFSPNFCD